MQAFLDARVKALNLFLVLRWRWTVRTPRPVSFVLLWGVLRFGFDLAGGTFPLHRHPATSESSLFSVQFPTDCLLLFGLSAASPSSPKSIKTSSFGFLLLVLGLPSEASALGASLPPFGPFFLGFGEAPFAFPLRVGSASFHALFLGFRGSLLPLAQCISTFCALRPTTRRDRYSLTGTGLVALALLATLLALAAARAGPATVVLSCALLSCSATSC